MQIKIGETVYEVGDLTKLSLLDVMKVNTELKPYGMSFHDLERIPQALAKLPREEAEEHPDAIWLTAVTVWASRRLAGEKVTFEEAIDFPMDELEIIHEATDIDDEPAESEPDPTAAASDLDAAPVRTATKTTRATSKRTSAAVSRS